MSKNSMLDKGVLFEDSFEKTTGVDRNAK